MDEFGERAPRRTGHRDDSASALSRRGLDPATDREFGFFDHPIYADHPPPLELPRASGPRADEPPKRPEVAAALSPLALRGALVALEARLLDRAVPRTAPGIGQEASAYFHIDETNHHDQLRAAIERLRRAIEAE